MCTSKQLSVLESMFNGESLSCDVIVKRLTQLQERINVLDW